MIKKILNFTSSLKFTLFLLFSLALTSIIGTVIPQGLSKAEYSKHFSPAVFKILDFFNVFDMYHSWWFITLLALLIINLIFCSLRHYRATIDRTFRDTPLLTDGILNSKSTFKKSFSVPKKKFSLEKIEEFLRKGYVKTEKEGEVHYFLNVNRISNLGYFVVHFSLILIAFGAIVGGIWGFKGMVNVAEGETVDRIFLKNMQIKHLPFKLKCIDFEVKFYPDGTPKDYRSLVEVIDGKERFRRVIRVNHPLKYRGITFYQASYGVIGERIKIAVFDRKDRKKVFEDFVGLKKPVSIDNSTKFVVLNYSQNFQGFGPAAQIAVVGADLKEHFRVKPFIIFRNYPDFDLKHRAGKYFFQLKEATFLYYTGLQVTKDPGVWIIWIGCFIMTVGFYITFFLINRKFWIKVSFGDKKVEIVFAGICRKNRVGFEKEFEERFEKLRNTLEGKV